MVVNATGYAASLQATGAIRLRLGPIDGRACARVHVRALRSDSPGQCVGQQLVEQRRRAGRPRAAARRSRSQRPGRQERERDVMNEIGHGRTSTARRDRPKKEAGAAAPKRAGPDLALNYRGRSRTAATTFRKSSSVDLHERRRNSGLSRGISLARRHAESHREYGIVSDNPVMILRVALFMACCRDRVRRHGVRGRAQRRQGAGRIRHQRRAARPVARSHLPLGKSRRDRPHLRRRVQRPGDRVRARRSARQSAQGVRAALELDPNNAQVRQNYELFKEINDRTTAKER